MSKPNHPFKRVLVIDFETAWSRADGYSLSVMTNEEYVRDKRFKAWGLCWKDLDAEGRATWVPGDRIRRWAASVEWETTAVIAHNAQFDITVLSWIYGVRPAFIIDTLSMARALRGVDVGNSLAKLANDYRLPAKGNAVHSTDGMLDGVPFGVLMELADYCRDDVFLCEELFKALVALEEPPRYEEWDTMQAAGYDGTYASYMQHRWQPQRPWRFPISELKLIDMTLRMYTEPTLQLDTEMLGEALERERIDRETLLQRLGVTDSDLASNDKFAQVLRDIGVEPPTKPKRPTAKTPNPVGVNFAFAKTDAHFQAMLNGDNEDVAALCEARLKVKSTTERTRAQRFIEIASRGSLPVPLSYYGALSGRWTASKGSAINMQNLKRGSFLRKAIMAPEDHVLAVGDLSQIEPRVLAYLAGYEDLLDIFRSGKDAYSMFGAQMFGVPTLSKETHPVLRQSAKSAMLGCGYQLGWASFAEQLLVGFLGAPPVRYDKAFAKSLGVDAAYVERFLNNKFHMLKMSQIAHTCTDAELLIHCVAAKKIIEIYRATASPIADLWKLYERLIVSALAEGEEYQHECLLFRKEEIVLPNGMSLKYPNLRKEKMQNPDTGKMEEVWVYGPKDTPTKLYPGKVTNNTTQAVARIVMTDGMLRVNKRYRVVGTVHDEQIDLVPKAEAREAMPWVLQQMTLEPRYLPGIPLAADGGYHQRYGLAKN